MQLKLTLLALSALGASIANAAAVDPRLLYMGWFYTGVPAQCPIATPERFIFGLGSDSPACRNFYNNVTYGAINVEYWIPQCLLTVHNTLDCSDPGIVSGTGGCWSPPGGIKAYTATCPWKNW
ncbi:hypothetical protein B0H67DRAFT_490711 [Lasiosphaeris hirsuta]|uniref:Uncharacterized protein n=1 Tax=Lasiosphaeris hirsuta TaxID=260670 RepID=A0AA40AGG6_9PEZI|nr:hypothetical protein B0H67DRAFT_490711 [Lasiosphaeris hirsuta]